MLEQRDVKMSVQCSQCIFELHFEATCHQHTVDVQTDALRPQCMREHFEAGFLLIDKKLHSTDSLFRVFSRLEKSCMIESLSNFSSSLLQFCRVHHTLRWTECSQLLCLFSLLFGSQQSNTQQTFPPARQDRIYLRLHNKLE